MFIELDPSVDADLSAQTESAIEFVDDLLSAHRNGHLIAVLSRRQALQFSDLGWLSLASRRTASHISKRLNDYTAAMASAARRIVILSPSVQNNFQFDGGVVRTSYRVLSSQHLTCQKFFLAEGRRDIDILTLISDEYYNYYSYPRNYVLFRPLIGGGGSCGQVLETELISPCKGYAVCDRDTTLDVPPFNKNSTGDKLHCAAKNLGLIRDDIGISEVSPFFGFGVTWGRTIENFVGPNLFGLYLSCNMRRAESKAFFQAFANFPNLDDVELSIWRMLNFKDGTRNLQGVLEFLRKNVGSVPPRILQRLEYMSDLKFPGDTLDWIISNQAANRWSRQIRQSVLKDFQYVSYLEGVASFAIPLLTLAAGDASAART
ncbi:hypothetical protein [Blastomonas sp. AAP25]|uniref:hypothetical protein n=1 Tax=Blastomonas sp. AAP25 TaxID=1523416 RepID=UPI000ADB1EA7|nr:hypothetical protein [Blastomonas sp. AAP25]